MFKNQLSFYFFGRCKKSIFINFKHGGCPCSCRVEEEEENTMSETIKMAAYKPELPTLKEQEEDKEDKQRSEYFV